MHCEKYTAVLSEGVRPAGHSLPPSEPQPGGGGQGELPLHGGHELPGLLRGVVQTQQQR